MRPAGGRAMVPVAKTRLASETMPSQLRTQPLTRDEVDQAYPLLREIRKDCTPESWRRYAASRLAPSSDVYASPGLVVTRLQSGIRAVASYRVDTGIADERMLRVRDVMVLGRPYAETLARHTLGGLLDVACRFECAVVQVELTHASLWLNRLWCDPRGALFRMPVICLVPGWASDDVPPEGRPGPAGEVVEFPAQR